MTYIGLTTFDIAIVILTLLMSFKGFFNGFLRELFGMLGLIGGVFTASRLSGAIAEQIDVHLFHLENFASLKLIGFLVLLALIWGSVVFVGNIIVGVSKEGMHSWLDRIFGLLMGGAKYFLIFSLITASLFRSPLVRDNVGSSLKKSILFNTLDTAGSLLINLTPLAQTTKTSTPKRS